MRYVSVIFATALAGVFANASAKADVFDFNFGPDAMGAFTTGAAANDPGYELITGLTFTVLVGEESDGGKFDFPKMTGQNFASGAAFAPTTGAFINHDAGGTFNHIGNFEIVGSGGFLGSVEGVSFEQSSTALIVNINGSPFLVAGPLKITQSPEATVPEASTWAMMLLGFAGLGFAGYRAKQATRRSSRSPKYVASVTS